MITSKSSRYWWRTEGVLGTLYRTQDDLKRAIRYIVARYPVDTPLSKADTAFMLDVFKHHAQWGEKAGVGVHHLVLRQVPSWSGPTTCFFIKRVDGSEIDISWVATLKPGGGNSTKTDVSLAARYEVVDQRNAADAAAPYGAPCPICGEPLDKGSRHVDHTPPNTFESLLGFWLVVEEGLDYPDVAIEDVTTANWQFTDRALALRWQNFHRAMAGLRVIHKHENLARVA